MFLFLAAAQSATRAAGVDPLAIGFMLGAAILFAMIVYALLTADAVDHDEDATPSSADTLQHADRDP